MKKHLFTAGAILSAAVFAIAAKNSKNPVLMNINGKDVHVSEFEYLYHKNNTQQLQPQTLDEYVDMFVNYKLKVADAEAAGLDTTESFIKEYSQFRTELSRPYLRDQSVEDSLVLEAYSHFKEDVRVSHIMVKDGEGQLQRLDSIRTAILSGVTTFEEAARKNSVDPNSRIRGGLMGLVVPERFPWAFEKAAYDTPAGEISPVINSGFGLHIIRVEERVPASGEVEASHILRLTQGKSQEDAAAQKAIIDSLYNVAASGADFADLATRFSEDQGSAKKGGSLGWFGRGMMVQPFDSISFALADGAVSEPFVTRFGYHIIKKHGHRGVAPLEEKKESILKHMKTDNRAGLPEHVYLENLKKAENASLVDATFKEVEKLASANSGMDSTLIATFATSEIPAYVINGKEYPLSRVVSRMHIFPVADATSARHMIQNAAADQLNSDLLDIARTKLAETNPDYRNLLNEYRDGILMYEISNRNVWDKASKDKEGLNEYFQRNRDKYHWDEPRFKSYIIFAGNDSVLNLAVAYADSLSTAVPADFVQGMRSRFGRDVRVDRVIAAKGENPITDYLAFGAEKPSSEKSSRWTSYTAYKGRIIQQPEEATDVRGAAVTDYQNELEKLWVEKLRNTYKVKINKKELKKVK